MDNEKALEALLFIAGEPLTYKETTRLLECDRKTLDELLLSLEEKLKDRGIRLLVHEDAITLSTAPEIASHIERFNKEQLEGDLSHSALETLAIILWKGKVSRSGIDYVRGVNSAFALRTLLIRGLVEREQDEGDARVFLYRPTINLLKYLGVSSVKELPNFESIQKEIKEYE